MKKCFNCGDKISRKLGNETREHVPSQGLFDGFDDNYKRNRITVPCCNVCNHRWSETIDEEFRNFIGSISSTPDLQQITDNTIKSVLSYRKQFNRIHIDEEGPGLVSNPNHIVEYLKKIFKGLYYHHYKDSLPDTYIIKVDMGDATNGNGRYSLGYLKFVHRFDFQHSGSEYIFKYIFCSYPDGPIEISQAPNSKIAKQMIAYVDFYNGLFRAIIYSAVIPDVIR